MKKEFLQTLKIIVLGLVVSVGMSVVYATGVWNPAPSPAPTGNTATPVHVGDENQTKLGNLCVWFSGVCPAVGSGNVFISDTLFSYLGETIQDVLVGTHLSVASLSKINNPSYTGTWPAKVCADKNGQLTLCTPSSCTIDTFGLNYVAYNAKSNNLAKGNNKALAASAGSAFDTNRNNLLATVNVSGCSSTKAQLQWTTTGATSVSVTANGVNDDGNINDDWIFNPNSETFPARGLPLNWTDPFGDADQQDFATNVYNSSGLVSGDSPADFAITPTASTTALTITCLPGGDTKTIYDTQTCVYYNGSGGGGSGSFIPTFSVRPAYSNYINGCSVTYAAYPTSANAHNCSWSGVNSLNYNPDASCQQAQYITYSGPLNSTKDVTVSVSADDGAGKSGSNTQTVHMQIGSTCGPF